MFLKRKNHVQKSIVLLITKLVFLSNFSVSVLSKWSKLQSGDILLFYKDKQYIASAILEGTEQNQIVAKQMWGTKPDSDVTWELIMYMRPESVRESNVDYQVLNKFLNYKENFMPTRTLDFTLVRQEATVDLEHQYGSLENALSSIGFNFGKTIRSLQDLALLGVK